MSIKGALQEQYAMTQRDIADLMNVDRNEVQKLEYRAYTSFKKALAERGINVKDLLGE